MKMSHLCISPEKLYKSDKTLKREDVEILIEWLKKQPHLPKLTESIVIIFLHSCFYQIEYTKTVIDFYFTKKTRFIQFFDCLDDYELKKTSSIVFVSVLPKKTHKNDVVVMVKLMDPRPEVFDVINIIRLAKMVVVCEVLRNGFSDGVLVLFDTAGFAFGHLPRLNLIALNHTIDLLKDGIPFRLKGFHVINVVPVIDKILALVRPLMGNKLYNMIHLHPSIETLHKHVPLECLPGEYGSDNPPSEDLQKKDLENILENYELIKWHDSQKVDESKRLEKSDTGLDGTFKKLEID